MYLRLQRMRLLGFGPGLLSIERRDRSLRLRSRSVVGLIEAGSGYC
jgi:hypothetical protein